eukprot:403370566
MLRSNITPIMNRKRQNYSQNSQTFDNQLSVREGTSRSQSPTKLQQQNAQEFQIFTDKNVFLQTMDNRVGQNSIQEDEIFSIIYDNQNFKNNLPFKHEMRYQSTRFKSQYNQWHKEHQEKRKLMDTFNQNNSVNKFYSEREYSHHNQLGYSQTKEEFINNFQSEQQVNLSISPKKQDQISQEIKSGQHAIQLRSEMKDKITRQNCTIKQPLLSGFGDKLVDERNLINQAGQELEFNIVDHKMRQTLKGEGFKELNFADKMRDHRQSNFKIGSLDNFAQGSTSQTPQNNLKQQLVFATSASPIKNNQNFSASSQMRNSNYSNNRYTQRPHTAQNNSMALQQQQTSQQSQRMQNSNNIQLVQNQKSIQQRPSTSIPQNSVLSSKMAYQQIKKQHTSSNVIMGIDHQFRHRQSTDYKNSYTWNVPKYAH